MKSLLALILLAFFGEALATARKSEFFVICVIFLLDCKKVFGDVIFGLLKY
jgi:hypothetical protein